MAAGLNSVLKHLRKVAAAENAEQLSDRQLVERFAIEGDEAAFAALVQRHGAMVVNVCRRVLQNDSDADDACQATFMVLARKASSIRKKDSVASWLHGVAHRAASNLRKEIFRRHAREGQAAARKSGPSAVVTWPEVQTILDEEIQRLPEKLKGPVLLCYLEGKAHNEGAQQLGWSLTTFRGRLERAREVLRKRLTQRGIALSGALLATFLSEKAAPAAVSASFSSVLVKAALAGETAKGVVALAQGVMYAMFWNKLKIGIVTLLLLVATVGLGGLGLHGFGGGGQTQALSAEVQGKLPAEGEDKGKSDAGAGNTRDPNHAFELLARGRGFFLVTDSSRLREPLTQFLKEKGIVNGQVTRELFAAFNKQWGPLADTYLIMVTLKEKTREAFLHNRWRATPPMRVSSEQRGFDWFRVFSEDREQEFLKANVVRIDPARIFFRKDDHVYALGLGETLQTALARGPTKLPEMEPFVPPPGKISWQVRDAPWNFVLESLVDQTRLDLISNVTLTGSFSWFDRKAEDRPKTRTKAEIVDFVAEVLEAKGYHLARRQGLLHLMLKDDFIATGKVLKVEGEEVFFQVAMQAYVIHAGETFARALARPLSANEIKKHGLKLTPVP